MRLGYNTNGLAAHRPADALALLAEAGYEAVAVTVDHAWLDPWSPRLADELRRMRELLARWRLVPTIETGARFLLDPRAKHQPTLLCASAAGRARRLDFLMRCVDLAAELEADCVSFWSGAPDDSGAHDAWARLTQGVQALVRYADGRGVRLAFEPEPGMFIDTFAQFERLLNALHGAPLGLACDVGHVHCLEEGPVSEHLLRWSERIVTMHVEDMRRGVHDHLPFGEGEVDFDDLFRALAAIDYRGSLNVELSRHSHAAAEMVHRSWQFLDGLRARFGLPRPAR